MYNTLQLLQGVLSVATPFVSGPIPSLLPASPLAGALSVQLTYISTITCPPFCPPVP